ncbi:MAG: extracellular catalytic domain type 1 short-chain-length polyhydroxyalkanoate depolymerase [Acidimicrobiales bacterium]
MRFGLAKWTEGRMRRGAGIAVVSAGVLMAPVFGLAPPAGAAAPAASGGCGVSATAGSSALELSLGGYLRKVIVHVPTGYSDAKPAPLVLDLHGSSSTARVQEFLSGMDSTSDAHGFLVAYPQALIKSATGYSWNVPKEPLVGGAAVPKGAANDVTFLTGVVGALSSRYCVDRTRVYATGMSGGGRMASQLACDAPRTFAAIAPVAGLRFPQPCSSARAVPLIAFHGTADPVDPYQGHGQGYWSYSVSTALKRWAAHERCASRPEVTQGPGFTLTKYQGCRSGALVELYALKGEGHEWPGGPPLPAADVAALGPQSNAVNADAQMWSFFSRYRL